MRPSESIYVDYIIAPSVNPLEAYRKHNGNYSTIQTLPLRLFRRSASKLMVPVGGDDGGGEGVKNESVENQGVLRLSDTFLRLFGTFRCRDNTERRSPLALPRTRLLLSPLVDVWRRVHHTVSVRIR